MTEVVPSGVPRSLRQLRRLGKIGQANGLLGLPGPADDPLADVD